jgi:hypothetical protein
MADRHIGNEGLRAVEGVPLNKWRTRAMTTNQPNSMGYLAAPGDLLTEVRGEAKRNLGDKFALHFGGEIVT